MNLLFLTPTLPYPPHQGAAIRNWGLIRHLARRHQVSLLSFADGDWETIAIGTRMLSQTVHNLVVVPRPTRSRLARLVQQLSPRPDLSYRLRSRRFDAELRRLLARQTFDVIQIEGLELARALKTIRASGTKARLVYDAHNVEHLLQRRAFAADVWRARRWPAALYSLIQWPRLRRYEGRVCHQVDLLACVSLQDAAAMRKTAPDVRTVLVPNGLRLAEYPYQPEAEPDPILEHDGVRTSRLLVFTGKMDYRPNVDAADWFVREILPLVHANNPTVQFAIVGQNPHPLLKAHTDINGVLVVGAVPDIRPYISGAAVYVMPLRMGSGTRFKMLEAMALGVPIVSTTLGKEGFSVTHGRELLLADTAEGFAEAVIRLLTARHLRQKLSHAGRRFVEERYDWSAIVPRLEAAYRM